MKNCVHRRYWMLIYLFGLAEKVLLYLTSCHSTQVRSLIIYNNSLHRGSDRFLLNLWVRHCMSVLCVNWETQSFFLSWFEVGDKQIKMLKKTFNKSSPFLILDWNLVVLLQGNGLFCSERLTTDCSVFNYSRKSTHFSQILDKKTN